MNILYSVNGNHVLCGTNHPHTCTHSYTYMQPSEQWRRIGYPALSEVTASGTKLAAVTFSISFLLTFLFLSETESALEILAALKYARTHPPTWSDSARDYPYAR